MSYIADSFMVKPKKRIYRHKDILGHFGSNMYFLADVSLYGTVGYVIDILNVKYTCASVTEAMWEDRSFYFTEREAIDFCHIHRYDMEIIG